MSVSLKCNIHNCNVPLNGHAWVTRCLHVFCREHGTSNFHNNRVQVNCPVCNEVVIQESDTLFCHTNPSDMILAGIRPEKILKLLDKSFKLWKYQLEVEKNHESSKVTDVSRQLEEATRTFRHILRKKEVEYNARVAALQVDYNEVLRQLNEVGQELEFCKKALRKYKVAYETAVNRRSPYRPHSTEQTNVEPGRYNTHEETSLSNFGLFGIDNILKDLENI